MSYVEPPCPPESKISPVCISIDKTFIVDVPPPCTSGESIIALFTFRLLVPDVPPSRRISFANLSFLPSAIVILPDDAKPTSVFVNWIVFDVAFAPAGPLLATASKVEETSSYATPWSLLLRNFLLVPSSGLSVAKAVVPDAGPNNSTFELTEFKPVPPLAI